MSVSMWWSKGVKILHASASSSLQIQRIRMHTVLGHPPLVNFSITMRDTLNKGHIVTSNFVECVLWIIACANVTWLDKTQGQLAISVRHGAVVWLV